MMRSTPTQVINGAVLANGTVIRGPMSCLRVSPGLYFLRCPPGKRLLGVTVNSASTIGWMHIAVDSETDMQCRVVCANTGGTVNVDGDFRYTATLAA